MKIGDKVRHKLSGDQLTIERINESVATCRRRRPIISIYFGVKTPVWKAVCSIENLEPIEIPREGQLTIF